MKNSVLGLISGVSFALVFTTLTGFTQKIIKFSDSLNEMGFVLLMITLGILTFIGLFKKS
jgi:type II secretory pathway component PulF